MKKKLKSFISQILVITLVLSSFIAIPSYVNATGETKITVSKSSIQSKGAYNAIQEALNTAKNKATSNNVYTITVEPGTYTLNHSLRPYSNTNLVLTNVTLTKSTSTNINLIHFGDIDEINSGATGYNAYKNINITNGTLDGKNGTNTLAKVGHASNVSFTGTTFKSNKVHLMEIAAVNGLTMKNCTFKDQEITQSNLTYEAIQVDILVKDHFIGYRAEDLPCKNITIDSCSFSNCPRGVGSHTSINNAPHTNINVTNCSFKNMGSIAVQFQGVQNCTITNNVIDYSPRAIAVYSVLNNGNGCYNASVLAKQGNTSAHTTDSYKTPTDAKITISDNVITRCGYFKDKYTSYVCSGISAIGYNVEKSTSTMTKGNYYLTGVNIFDNEIEVKGHGIRLANVRNTIADNNIIKCSENTNTPANYYGISGADGAAIQKISNNIITGAPVNGIFLNGESSISSINNNSVNSSGKYGIAIEKSKATSISENSIKNTVSSGIHITDSTAGSITKNALSGIGANAFNIVSSSTCNNLDNNIVTSCTNKYVNIGSNSSVSIGNTYYSDSTSSVALSNKALVINEGEKYTLSKTVSPADSLTTYVWTSSNNSVASVSGGVITAKKAGKTTITVKTFNEKSATCEITVKAAIKSSTVTLNTSKITLGVGESYTVKATTSPTGNDVTWSTSNSSVATVSEGKITAKSEGTATITAKTPSGYTASGTVTVKPAPSSVTTNPQSLILGVGESYTIAENTNSGTYANAANLKWSSSNTGVATVAKGSGNKATIKAVKAGTTNITIKLYNGKTATCKLTIKSAPISVTTNPQSLILGAGETYTISENTNSGAYANAANLKWSSSNTSVATVTKGSGNKAMVKAIGTGTANIKITLYNGKTATCKVTIKPAPSSVKTNPTSVTLGVGESYTISEGTNSGTYANAANLKWSSSDTSVATVTKGSGNKAKITAKGVGTAYVKITLFNGKTAQCKVTVKPAPTSVKLSKTSITLNKGQTYTISESTNSGSYANASNLKWSSTNSSVATVKKGSANKATITAKAKGTTYIKITLYNGKTVQCKVTVK